MPIKIHRSSKFASIRNDPEIISPKIQSFSWTYIKEEPPTTKKIGIIKKLSNLTLLREALFANFGKIFGLYIAEKNKAKPIPIALIASM
jgi:hypothetical protein